MSAQPTLFPLPRHLEPGEPCRCICGRTDASGTYGPPGLESLTLQDGHRWVKHTVRLDEVWLCAPCARQRWDDWRDNQVKVPERLRLLRTRRWLEQQGLRGAALHVRLAELVADPGWHPPAPGAVGNASPVATVASNGSDVTANIESHVPESRELIGPREGPGGGE